MPDNRVMTLDLISAESLMVHVAGILELGSYLDQAIWHAENGDICNDVFLFEYVPQFIAVAVQQDINYVISGEVTMGGE